MKRNPRREAKDRVLSVLYQHRKLENAIDEHELGSQSFMSHSELKKIIFELAVKDKIPIALNPNPPYGLYIKDGQG